MSGIAVLAAAKDRSALGAWVRQNTDVTESTKYTLPFNLPPWVPDQQELIPQLFNPGQVMDFTFPATGRINQCSLKFEFNVANATWNAAKVQSVPLFSDPLFFWIEKIEVINDGTTVLATIYPENWIERSLATTDGNQTHNHDWQLMRNPYGFEASVSKRLYTREVVSAMDPPVFMGAGMSATSTYVRYVPIPAYFIESVNDQIDVRQTANLSLRVYCTQNTDYLRYNLLGGAVNDATPQRDSEAGPIVDGILGVDRTNSSTLRLNLAVEYVVPGKRTFAALIANAKSFGSFGQTRMAYDSILERYSLSPAVVANGYTGAKLTKYGTVQTVTSIPLTQGYALTTTMIYVAPDIIAAMNPKYPVANLAGNGISMYYAKKDDSPTALVHNAGKDANLFRIRGSAGIRGLVKVALMMDSQTILEWNEDKMLQVAYEAGYNMHSYKNVWILPWKHDAGFLNWQQGILSTATSSSPSLELTFDHTLNTSTTTIEVLDPAKFTADPLIEVEAAGINSPFDVSLNQTVAPVAQTVKGRSLEYRVLHIMPTTVSFGDGNIANRRVFT